MQNSKVVIDTNVFISAIIGKKGYSYKIFEEFIFTGEVVMCLSPQLINEYVTVSSRSRLKKLIILPKMQKFLLLQ